MNGGANFLPIKILTNPNHENVLFLVLDRIGVLGIYLFDEPTYMDFV